MNHAHDIGRSPSAPVRSEPAPRSLLSMLFLLSLGVIYPLFLALVFLRPDWLLQLFRSSSGSYLISGLSLGLLGLCLFLATMHFRAADRQYRQQLSEPISSPSPTLGEQEKQYPSPLNHSAVSAHQHNHPGE